MKGYIYTLEMLFVVFLVFTSLVVILGTGTEKPESQLSTLKRLGVEALEYLDAQGSLRTIVNSGAEDALEDELRDILPRTVRFETDICTTTCTTAGLPSGRDIVAVDYHVATYRDSLVSNRVRLWLWGQT